MFCGHTNPTTNNNAKPINGKIHASKNDVCLDNFFATSGKMIYPTTSAIDALIIKADNMLAFPHTYVK